MLSDYILIYSLPSSPSIPSIASYLSLPADISVGFMVYSNFGTIIMFPSPLPRPCFVHVFFRVSLFALSIVSIPVVPAINPDILLIHLVQVFSCIVPHAAFTHVPHNYVDSLVFTDISRARFVR
ncbi:hypothetical protein QCA50_001081 [Cerrena zonata]|uniref:Uncharacterized protein n=1 Tax=Cerrena zonata TaxID=2478898 RepID=A0AAW0GXV5_9APHY